jgi:hypothetical protein
MRHALLLAVTLTVTSCASSAFAAGPHAFDPDGPRPATPHRIAPPVARPARPTTPLAAQRTAPTRTPAPVPRPAPSVSLEPPPPPGMNILRHMMRHTRMAPQPLGTSRGNRPQPSPDEGWVL